ncbi:MAG: N-acetylmuramoyl-L-alanine amidase [Oscillospiraceae bacterium]|nr:N-acetylmuramoyl-L-alanine amidase [Oscillospiraceae bacterium]
MAAYRKRKRRRSRRGGGLLAGIGALVLLISLGALAVELLRGGDLPAAGVEVPSFVERDFIPLNRYSRPGTDLKKIEGVVIHYVGNPATTAKANRDYFANLSLTGETYASAHFVVGLEGEIIQCVPMTEVAYCSNDRNRDTVSIEVCHADETGEFSPETMESLVELTAWLAETFGLAREDIIRHYDVTGKICPKFYVEHEDAWQALLDQVEAEQLRAAEELN